MVTKCPECGENATEVDHEQSFRGDEKDIVIHRYYVCDDGKNCGCEFTITEKTTYTTEITNKGKGLFQSS